MTTYEYGSTDAPVTLLQMADDHDLSVIESEAEAVRNQTDIPFHLIAVKVRDWNRDLSPWPAPAVFGNEMFGDGAAETLEEIMKLCPGGKPCIIGGYSLAGLFALWASYQTEIFAAAAAASPSIWFPGFTDYMKEHACRSKAVYLSLGDREEKTRHPVMSTVGDRIREGYEILQAQGVRSTLEWNKGNHFKNPDLRTAKAFAWAIGEVKRDGSQ